MGGIDFKATLYLSEYNVESNFQEANAKNMNEDLINKILDSDISKEAKEKILFYWLLPPEKGSPIAPIQKGESKSGAVRRPSREEIDLRKNPKKREEQEEMTKSLDEATKDDK